MEDKLNKNRVIILSCALAFCVIATAGVFLFTNKKSLASEENNKCNDVSLGYYPLSLKTKSHDISISSSDAERLSEILDNLESSDKNETLTDVKYKLKYCDDTYFVGEEDKMTKNGKTVKPTSEKIDLKEFIEGKSKELNKVYLYLVDMGVSYNRIDITEEEKNNIRKYWKEQDKTVEHLEKTLDTKYYIVIDNENIMTDESHYYAAYKDGFVVLDERIGAIINKYFPKAETTTSELKYTINNNMSSYNQKYKDRGVYTENSNTFTIASGVKNSGGNSINVDKVDIDADGNVIVHVIEKSPAPNEASTMAITYPTCGITFDKAPKSIKVIDEKNQELKSITINEVR